MAQSAQPACDEAAVLDYLRQALELVARIADEAIEADRAESLIDHKPDAPAVEEIRQLARRLEGGMMEAATTIGELAKQVGTTTKTLRYYERIGLPVASGTEVPTATATMTRATFTQLRYSSRQTGLTLSEIGQLMNLPASRCNELRLALEQAICAQNPRLRAQNRRFEDADSLQPKSTPAPAKRLWGAICRQV